MDIVYAVKPQLTDVHLTYSSDPTIRLFPSSCLCSTPAPAPTPATAPGTAPWCDLA